MYSFLPFPVFLLILLVITCTSTNPSVEWMQDWSAELPSGGTGKHRGWIGFGSDRDGGKYVENGWQNSWQSENSGGDSSWDGKQISDDGWDASGKHKWSWGNGGSHGWGTWGNSGKQGLSRHYGVDFGDDTISSIGFGPESSYTSWGNTNTDSWKNSGGGEGWRKWKADDQGPGRGGHEHGGWRGWKSGSGGGNWNSWKSSNKPANAKAEAFASASADP